jgi:hypothetical protein
LPDDEDPWVSGAKLANRVSQLEERGVRFHRTVPAPNVDSASEHLRSEFALVLAVEALAACNPPETIIVEPGTITGDVDILVEGAPVAALQVKSLAALDIQLGGQPTSLLAIMNAARDAVLDDQEYGFPSTFSRVVARRDDKGTPVFDGETRGLMAAPLAKVIVLEADPSLFDVQVAKKIEKAFRQAKRQLLDADRPLDDALVVWLDLTQTPHDQAAAIQQCRGLIARDSSRRLAGIVLATAGYLMQDNAQHAVIQPRMIPIPNPYADQEQQDWVRNLNPEADDEWLYAERPTSIFVQRAHRVSPGDEIPQDLFSVREGRVYVDGHCFGTLHPESDEPNYAFTHAIGDPRPPRLHWREEE